MITHHLAQINVARLIAPKGDARVQPFFDALDAINAIADASPGFVWRLADDSGNATGINPSPDDRLLINISVWESAEALFGFVYRSAHAGLIGQRRDWFERFDGAFQALWWVPAGQHPTVADGLGRLWLLDRHGPSPSAFGFKSQFPPPA